MGGGGRCKPICCAPTSNSIGRIAAMRISISSWANCRRPSARICARSARRSSRAGIEFDWLTGADITEAHWDRFFEFYMDTGGRKWGHPYLTREFFSRIGASHGGPDSADHGAAGTAVTSPARSICSATAFCIGRNWGAVEYVPFLHFETCYYQAIDFAIARGLEKGGSRRPGRAQIAARLYAGGDLQRPLHRP